MPLILLENEGMVPLPANLSEVRGWRPINSPQLTFLECRAQLALFGGQSGGGKSNVLVADSAQEYANPHFRGILLRQSYSEMTNLMDEMEKIYRPLGARSADGRKLWRFPAGGQMRLGYMASDKDVSLYTGKPVSWLGIDEAQFQTEARVRKLFPWVATPIEYGLRDRIRLTANPSTPWLMSLFLNNACPVCHPGKSTIPCAIYQGAHWKDDDGPVMKTTAFIPAKVSDNPLYGQQKIDALKSQTEDVQRKLLLGCWCNTEGAFFPFLNQSYVLPYSECGEQWWHSHFLSTDYGFNSSAAATGLYFMNDNGLVFKVGEDVQRKMYSDEYAHHIAQKFLLRSLSNRQTRIVQGYADPAMDAHTGTGQSNLEIINGVLDQYGFQYTKAAKDRIGNAQFLAGKLRRREFVLTDLVPKTYESLTSRKSDPDMPGAILKVATDELDDLCFVAGTVISTQRGSIPIERICDGDRVLTHKGWRPVLGSGLTSLDSHLATLETRSRITLKGTLNHPVFVVGKGFIRLSEISVGDIIVTCPKDALSLMKSFIEALHSEDIQSPGTGTIERISRRGSMIAREASRTFIGKFGKTTSAPSRRAISSTTKTKIRSTMIRRITLFSRAPITWRTTCVEGLRIHNTLPRSKNMWPASAPSPKNGIVPRKAYDGIAKTAKERASFGRLKSLSAKNVGMTTRPSTQELIVSARPSVTRSGVATQGLIMRTERANSALVIYDAIALSARGFSLDVVSSLTIGGRGAVYNLTVADAHEYFANGILVHNCDETLYGLNNFMSGDAKPQEAVVEERVQALRQAGADDRSIQVERHRMEQKFGQSSGPVQMGRPTIGRAGIRR